MKPPVSVILIRENAEQLTGSGCCGKLEGENSTLGSEKLFEHSRKDQEELGILHRVIREFFPSENGQEQVAVVTVDPRNQLYLVPKLLGDVFRYRPGIRSGLRAALQLFSLPAVVVNGQVISRRGRVVNPDLLCHQIRDLLARAYPNRNTSR